MEMLLHYWPIVAFVIILVGSLMSLSMGLTMWIMGRLSEQNAARIEMKEVILKEVRERHHLAVGGMDQRYVFLTEKIDDIKHDIGWLKDDLGNRMTRVETALNGTLTGHKHPKPT